ncbi:MAG: LysE family transporter [bacterium]|nr:LysE family transporter [bacterium]
MKQFFNGLITGLTLQLAVGPVFFFIANMTIQGSTVNGFAGVLAVTLVDYIYILLSVFGIGQVIQRTNIKKIFGMVSSLVLVIFGFMLIKSSVNMVIGESIATTPTEPLISFGSVFLMTISSPMTIMFFTSLFTAKVLEYGYVRNELLNFGLGTGFATFVFMGISVIIFSFMKGIIPIFFVQILNIGVGVLLVGYGAFRFVKHVKQ